MKSEIGTEKYLTEVKNVNITTQVTKFCLSDHKHMIEVGRHKGVKAHLRICPLCNNDVETEIHVLLECPIYKHLRWTLMNTVLREKPSIKFFTKENKFSYILANSQQKEVAEFIYKSLELRNFLVTPPKRVE